MSRPLGPQHIAEQHMNVEYFHASKYGNGVKVAEEFARRMASRGVAVNVRHIKDVSAKDLPPADLYLFSSPGRMGKPIGGMRRFLKGLQAPVGARYAILTTEGAPQPDKTGRIPTEEEQARYQRVIPIMSELLQGAGMVEVAAAKVLVTGLKGPLEDGWESKVDDFADRLEV